MENDMNTFGNLALRTLIAVEANEKRIRDDMAATLKLQREQGVPVWDDGTSRLALARRWVDEYLDHCHREGFTDRAKQVAADLEIIDAALKAGA